MRKKLSQNMDIVGDASDWNAISNLKNLRRIFNACHSENMFTVITAVICQ